MTVEFTVLLVIALYLELLAVQGLAHVVDTGIFAIEQHLDHLAARAVAGVGQRVGIPGTACHVEPQVGAHAVAHAQEVDLTGIQNPTVVVAQAKEAVVLLGGVLCVDELDAVVAFVLAGQVGCTTTPFHLGYQRLSVGRVGLAHGHRTHRVGVIEGPVQFNVLVAEITDQFHDGQPGEGDVAGDDLLAHVGGDGVVLASLDTLKGDGVAALNGSAVDDQVGQLVAEGYRGFEVVAEE